MILAVAACASCAAASRVEAPRAIGDAPPARRPDAVVLEPVPARPAPSTRAEAYGVVALRQPIAAEAVALLVRAWVEAWQRESLEGLTELLSPDAVPIDAQGRGRAALVDSFRQRLAAHDYGRLAGLELVRADRIQHLAYDDFAAGPANGVSANSAGASVPARPPEMRRDDLYVRAP
ncbi:MAG: nuclear transport factor 2 family protein, partial [Polyangiaceae bacterium]|nr:nuclear transport factor 2 family protein [Polyangiaceae bacterium]